MKTDLSSVEEETLKRVNHTVGTIQGFLSRWDASSIKAEDLFPQIGKIRDFRDALLRWQREAVKAKKGESNDERVRRLQEFVLLCRTYS